MRFCKFCVSWIFIKYYPLHTSGTPPQTTNGGASKKVRIKRESQFQPTDHWTRPISCGGLNQREPPVLPGSPSPHASGDTLFCQPHVRLRSSVNPAATIVGGNWGESGVLVALGNISCPNWPSGACSAFPLDRTCRRATGTSWISSFLLRVMVPRWTSGGGITIKVSTMGWRRSSLLLGGPAPKMYIFKRP